jgi:D-lactate dehydrogenase
VIVAVYSSKPYDQKYLLAANQTLGHRLIFLEERLSARTAALAAGCGAVCAFVNDRLDRPAVEALHGLGVRLIALRSAGFNHVDVAAARGLGMTVTRVPAYSPDGVAEHTVGLMLALNRKIHRAYNRVREGNFALDGLLGFNLRGKTVGVVGTGKIGEAVTRILAGFGCGLIGYDPYPNAACAGLGMRYLPLTELLAAADIVTLHCPLTAETRHMIDAEAISRMKRGAMLINTSRGGLIETAAAIAGLKQGQIGYLGLDVYEEEEELFFEDFSDQVILDDVFMRLLTFPNVIVTGHQAFFTEEALVNIAESTLASITDFEAGLPLRTAV